MICKKCNHYTTLHYSDNNIFQCWERLSHDNNDFCGCEHGKKIETIKLYVIKNSDGKYYDIKNDTWEKDINNAKIYRKIGYVKSRITFFKKYYKEHPIPVIVVLEAKITEEIIKY